MENRIERNIPPIIIINIEMKTITSANVLQTNESKVRQNQQNVFLLGKWLWSRFDQGAN
jgi:hypothetical protein